MGLGSSKPKEQPPFLSLEDIRRLKDKGHLPIVAIPSKDVSANNALQTIYIAEYEHGTELTLLFLDEDRPNFVTDFIYDRIRRTMFGRGFDIESIFILKETVEFPGTYAGNQTWTEKLPQHERASVELTKFQRKEEDEGDNKAVILWVNTWNHLFAEQNTNPDVDITYCHPSSSNDTLENLDSSEYVVRKGSREDVDALFKGFISSLKKVKTEEMEAKLGKRLL